MDRPKLEAATRRADVKHAKNLRRMGLVPAVIYGRDQATQHLEFDARPLEKVLAKVGTYQLVDIQIDGTTAVTSLAREIQRDVIKRNCMHVDFYIVDMAEKVTAQVPVILEGQAPGVIDKGGVLTQGLDQLEVECLPGDLVPSIMVSVENLLDFNDTIIVADLTVPETLTVLSDSESMIAKIEAPRREEELEALDEELIEVTSAEPEVISEARDEEEEEAAPPREEEE